MGGKKTMLRTPRPWRAIVRVAVVLCAAALCIVTRASAPLGAADAETAAALRFEALRTQPDRLAAFIALMPKGADLHNHASGAVYAENYVAWALADGDCYAPQILALKPVCAAGDVKLSDGIARDPSLVQSLVRSLSMENFVPVAESGHDHFFSTFAKFGGVPEIHNDRLVADATRDAERNGVVHLELMENVGDVRATANRAGGFDPERFAEDDERLDGAGFAAAFAAAREQAATMEAGRRRVLRCDAVGAEPACGVDVSYLYQVIRTDTPPQVFAEMRLGFALAAEHAGGYVGVNIVAPEDAPVAVRDYALHMRMFAYFHRRYPSVSITLHAGELTPALVGPEALRDHIRQAVEVGAAQRIGHGVDVLGERDAPQLLEEMARRGVLVEIALTSNDQILSVRGSAHPLPAYLAAGVPVALSTDDPGVSRGNLTAEYLRAALTYGFDYRTLKRISRMSLHHAFVSGASLWSDETFTAHVPACTTSGDACARYLSANPRAALEARLEQRLAAFETNMAAEASAR